MTLDTNAGDTSTPYMRPSSERMSRVDRPRAYNATMLALKPSRRRAPLGTILGSNVALRSPVGTSRSTAPISVNTCLGEDPLRLLPVPWPIGSPDS